MIVTQPDDLDLAAIERVAFDGEAVTLTDELLASVDTARSKMLETLAHSGRVYGITTGMGYLSTVDLDSEAQATHQRQLLMGRAVGSAPWLPRTEVRALMTVRLAELLRGHAGASRALCTFLADRLGDDFCPAVPARGVGTAGEIQPLAHAFQTFVGVGRVLVSGGPGTEDAAGALARRGVVPYEPGIKEGLALLAGAPAAVALVSSRLRTARRLISQTTVVAASSCAAAQVPCGPYDRVHAELARDPVLGNVLEDLGALLDTDETSEAGEQAPVSFRVLPQALAYVHRTADRVAADTSRRLAAVTDSPVYVDERFVTSGAFHAIELAAGLDQLAAALVHLGELSAQRIHRLMDSDVTGLPTQLTANPGAGCGLIVVHKRAVGAVNELRRLAMPVTVGLAETSLGQEDAQTFTFEAAERLRRVEQLVTEVTACEALCARQARWLRGRRDPHGLANAVEAVDALVSPVEADRPLGGDIDALIALLDSDGLAPPPSPRP